MKNNSARFLCHRQRRVDFAQEVGRSRSEELGRSEASAHSQRTERRIRRVLIRPISVRFYFLCANAVPKIRALGVGAPVETTEEFVLVGF